MQIYTITREDIERYKRENEDQGLPDNCQNLCSFAARALITITITREDIERYKRENEDHGLPDNLDLLVAAVAYDPADNRAINANSAIRWISVEMSDAHDNVIDMANVPKRTVYQLVNQQQMRRDFEKRREARLRRMGAL